MEIQYYQQKHLQKTFPVQIPKLSVKRIKQSILTRVIEKRKRKDFSPRFFQTLNARNLLFSFRNKPTTQNKKKKQPTKTFNTHHLSVPCIKMRLKKTQKKHFLAQKLKQNQRKIISGRRKKRTRNS
jgi:broad specificity polyphosphatase/5'/3'-nucleotidase SurE